MKKVLAFVLVLSMILGSFGMAFAGNAQSDALTVLSGLGVFAGYTDGSMGEDKVVTRAEAATLIIKAMDLQDYAVGKTTFTDMDEAKWAEPFVAYAVSLGFVKGNTDGTFAPNATVTSDQMITMLVQAIGYKAEYLTGGYPGAFVNTAKALGILEGVKSGAEGCTRGDVAQMIYNALEVPFVSYDAEGGLQYTVMTGGARDCFMERLIADLAKSVDVIVYGDEDSKIDLKPYQGAKATLIWDDEEVVAVDDVKSVFVVGDADLEEGIFETADKEYKLDRVIGVEVPVFVNGEYATDAAIEAADDLTIAAKLSGKYVDELYSIAYWNAEATIQWTEELAEELEDDQTLNGETLLINDEDEIDMDEIVLVGVESLDKIAEDAIVTYYLAGGEYEVVKVEVSTEVVEGKITKVNKAGDEVTINGKKYDTDIALELGDEGTFFLNYAGDIAAFEGVSTKAEDYAIITYAMEAIESDAYGEDDVVTKVKMITEDGKEAVYVVEEDYAEEINASIAAFGANTVVVYNLDKNGEIDKIETVDMVAADGAELTAKGFLAGYEVSADVVVFTFDGEDYKLAAKADIPAGEELGDTFFALNDDEEIVFVILDAEAGEDAESVYAVVTGASKVKNADDDTVWEVELLVDGEEAVKLTTSVEVVAPDATELFELVFDGDDIEEFVLVEGVEAVAVDTKAGNIKVEGAGYVEVASDVVVYLINEDGDFEVSKIEKIGEGDTVVLYQLDDDDKDGVDVVIYTEA